MAEAIRSMVIRGAPAIGVAAAMGVAIGASKSNDVHGDMDGNLQVPPATRPIRRKSLLGNRSHEESVCERQAGADRHHSRDVDPRSQQIYLEDIAINRAIGQNGADLVPDGKTVLTHCNAGGLRPQGSDRARRYPGGGSGRQEDRRIRGRNASVHARIATDRVGTCSRTTSTRR